MDSTVDTTGNHHAQLGGAHCRPLDLTEYFNNVGISTERDIAFGQFNIWRNSYAAEELPSAGTVTVCGIHLHFPPHGTRRPDNIRCEGQYIQFTPGRYEWAYLLISAERRVEDQVALHFTDGNVDFEAIRASDFWAPTAAFGERPAFRTSRMHYPRHVQPDLPAVIWLQRVPVVRQADELAAMRLPKNLAIHVFAITLTAGIEPAGERTANA